MGEANPRELKRARALELKSSHIILSECNLSYAIYTYRKIKRNETE